MITAGLAKKSHDFAVDTDPIIVDITQISKSDTSTLLGVTIRLHSISSYIQENAKPVQANTSQLLGILVKNNVHLPVVSKDIGLEFIHPTLGKVKIIEMLPKMQLGEIYGYKGVGQVIGNG